MRILELFKPLQAHTLVSSAQVVKANEHWVVASILDLVLNDDPTPVVITLWSLVSLIMQIAIVVSIAFNNHGLGVNINTYNSLFSKRLNADNSWVICISCRHPAKVFWLKFVNQSYRPELTKHLSDVPQAALHSKRYNTTCIYVTRALNTVKIG